ncbi:MAG: DUF2637 domain-containing protein, partial [Chitinophagaceae bacterium]|nr:DUF2637 domain-containing protein [Chitinophagaceae bacterium]
MSAPTPTSLVYPTKKHLTERYIMSGISIVPLTYFDSQKNYKKIIAWITGLLTLLLALFSFILSFNALADLAINHGVSIPILFPLVVEAGVIIFSLNALYRSLHGESAKWQWCLVISSSLLAGGFNILHAPPDLVSRIMAAMPSLFLLLSFETLLSQIKHSVTRTHVIQSIVQLTSELESKRQELDLLIDAKGQEIERLHYEADELETEIEVTRTALVQVRQENKTEHTHFGSIPPIQITETKNGDASIELRRDALIRIIANEGDI